MTCPSCSHANLAGSKFCEECGSALGRACSSCGSELGPAAKFCSECGTRVEGAGLAAVPAAAPERAPSDYTPKHLADKILRSKSALEGERKQVTVLIADVKGSLELAGTVGAEEWHRILDRFFQILANGVHRFEGRSRWPRLRRAPAAKPAVAVGPTRPPVKEIEEGVGETGFRALRASREVDRFARPDAAARRRRLQRAPRWVRSTWSSRR